MKKLIRGIVDFRRNVQKEYRLAFGRLVTGQSPDALFIACSDSRVVPNTFASTNPGDLFVIRNMGNLVPPCGEEHDHQKGHIISDESASAIEYSVEQLNVSDIIVCGHSECGAMRALYEGRDKLRFPNMRSWLRHGEPALERLRKGLVLDPALSEPNQLSQLNVLLQMEHVKSYPSVQRRLREGTLKVHGWWFDVGCADVYAINENLGRFVLIDEKESERLLKQLETEHSNETI